MKYLLLMLLSFNALAVDKIVIMDTGLNHPEKFNLCKAGHYDFIKGKAMVGKDHNNHGTIIASILNNIPNTCLVIYKIYETEENSIYTNDDISTAFKKLLKVNPKYVNISMSGKTFYIEEEYYMNKMKDTLFYVAAGNDDINLDVKCNVFPACNKAPNIVPVSTKEYNKGKVIKKYYNKKYKNKTGTSFASPQQLREDILNATN